MNLCKLGIHSWTPIKRFNKIYWRYRVCRICKLWQFFDDLSVSWINAGVCHGEVNDVDIPKNSR
jgi:hypothetical protein